jgi:hypothetical protein
MRGQCQGKRDDLSPKSVKYIRSRPTNLGANAYSTPAPPDAPTLVSLAVSPKNPERIRDYFVVGPRSPALRVEKRVIVPPTRPVAVAWSGVKGDAAPFEETFSSNADWLSKLGIRGVGVCHVFAAKGISTDRKGLKKLRCPQPGPILPPMQKPVQFEASGVARSAVMAELPGGCGFRITPSLGREC